MHGNARSRRSGERTRETGNGEGAIDLDQPHNESNEIFPLVVDRPLMVPFTATGRLGHCWCDDR